MARQLFEAFVRELAVGFAYSQTGGPTHQQAEHPKHADYPLMTRNTPVNGHVSVVLHNGVPYGEALLVDRDGRNKQHYEAALSEIQQQLPVYSAMGMGRTEAFLRATFANIDRRMKYYAKAIDSILRSAAMQNKVPYDGVLVEAWDVVRQGVGVCRHMALPIAGLLEMDVERGLLEGTTRFRRLIHPDRDRGHAWAYFENSRGDAFILDPAQGYCGRQGDRPLGGWPYLLSSEPQKHNTYWLLQRTSGGMALVAKELERDRGLSTVLLNPKLYGANRSYVVQSSSGQKYVIG